MAKEFKEWEKRFSTEEIRRERVNWLSRIPEKLALESWEFGVASWSHEEVRKAVYEARDAESWQKLRIALKGTTTQQKLAILVEYMFDADNFDREDRWVMLCRVDNYIGALKRGGQLDSQLRIVK